MHKLNVLRLAKLTLALLFCSSLVVGTDWTVAPSAAPPAPQSECNGAAKDCKWPVKFIGEKNGCSCFACEYGKPTQRVICTKSDEDKRTLRKLELERTAPRDNPAPRVKRGRPGAKAMAGAASYLG